MLKQVTRLNGCTITKESALMADRTSAFGTEGTGDRSPASRWGDVVGDWTGDVKVCVFDNRVGGMCCTGGVLAVLKARISRRRCAGRRGRSLQCSDK